MCKAVTYGLTCTHRCSFVYTFVDNTLRCAPCWWIHLSRAMHAASRAGIHIQHPAPALRGNNPCVVTHTPCGLARTPCSPIHTPCGLAHTPCGLTHLPHAIHAASRTGHDMSLKHMTSARSSWGTCGDTADRST